MEFLRREHKRFNKGEYRDFILAGDVGATNCNLGIFGLKGKFPKLLVSFHFKSKKLKNLHGPINLVLDYAGKEKKILISKCCLGIAGVLSYKKDYVKLTNASLQISLNELYKKTSLLKIILMNDFEAVGYGISMIPRKDIKTIKKGTKIVNAPIVVIGAGTGLGKTIMYYAEKKKIYIPMPSEIHHADFPAQDKAEMELAGFIKKHRRIKNVSNGDVLSGDGLENIYLFLRKAGKFKKTKIIAQIDKSKNKPELISKYGKEEPICRKTFEIFKMAYARFAKNCALDALSFNGVYIAGGIAPKNKDIFDYKFIEEFEKSNKMSQVLKKIPIYLVLNYDAGLLGAGFAGAMMLK